MHGKLSGLEKDILEYGGYGGEYDRGIYGGESRKAEAGEEVLQKLCG